MDSSDSDTGNLSTSPTTAARFGAARNRYLLAMQVKMLRGLKSRWQKLSASYAVDSIELSRKSEELQSEFSSRFATQTTQHREELSNLVTNWDEELDRAVTKAELETLEKIRWERSTLKSLKTKRKDSEAKQQNDFSITKARLEGDLDKGRSQAKQTRDQGNGKLDLEQEAVAQSMQEIRDWIGAKTGNSKLSQWTVDESIPPRSLQHITNLSTLSKEYEEAKSGFLTRIEELRSSKVAQVVSLPILLVLAVLFGGLAFGSALLFQAPPLILGLSALLSAILVPTIVYLCALPFVGKSVKNAFEAVVKEEHGLRELLQRGRTLIEGSYRSEIGRVDERFRQSLAELESRHQNLLNQIEADYQANKEAAIASTLRDKKKFADTRAERFSNVQREYPVKLDGLRQRQARSVEELKRDSQSALDSIQACFRHSQEYLTKRWTEGLNQFRALMERTNADQAKRFPSWSSKGFQNENCDRDGASLAFPLGKFVPSVAVETDHPVRERSDEFQSLDQLATKMGRVQDCPVLLDLIGNGAFILRSEDPESREQVQSIMRNILLRAVTGIPAGMLQVTVIDPEGLGKKYSWLMHLADIDPELVNHRVWTQPIHIANQLALTTRHIEDVIQQSLRNQYRNLYEYNQKAGPMAIPYRIIVWSGFPFGLDDSSWQSLCSILSSGSRCGVGVIIDWPTSIQWPTFADPDKLREFALVGLVHRSGTAKESLGRESASANEPFVLQLDVPELKPFPIDFDHPPEESTVAEIMKKHLIAASNVGKRIVPFSTIAPKANDVHTKSSADGLEIPIGISDAGRPQYLSLGEGTSQHVLIAGKTGSGKSSLLHTLVSSAALEYSPEELRLVLLDFKKGVEFQVYSELELSHADIIGIESRREFGLSTLEYLDRVLSARGEAFRSWGVQDLPSLKRKHPDVQLPRILIVIDEFQELFVEDDKLSQQASMLMDRIVRQGRSFGMHLVLASQTLGGAYSLPRTTLAQMAVRIALQCDSADAMLILSEDNTAAERLRHSGQGIYNASGGRMEANQNFQVAYLPKREQIECLSKLPRVPVPHAATTNSIGRRVVFEGHKMAAWDNDSVSAVLKIPSNASASSLWILGESVSIEPSVAKSFSRSPGRNAMIVCNQEDLVGSLLASWIGTERSRCATSDRGKDLAPTFRILDGSREEDPTIRACLEYAKQLKDCTAFAPRQIDEMFTDLEAELEKRSADPQANHPTVNVVIVNLGRFRELRREEDFSFGGGEGGSKPDAILSKLLSDGPPLGIHVCVWSDSVSTITRWLSRSSLRDIEIRILGQMSANDSNQLIDNNQANRLDRYVMLVHDDSDGKGIKFRPFMIESVLEKKP